MRSFDPTLVFRLVTPMAVVGKEADDDAVLWRFDRERGGKSYWF